MTCQLSAYVFFLSEDALVLPGSHLKGLIQFYRGPTPACCQKTSTQMGAILVDNLETPSMEVIKNAVQRSEHSLLCAPSSICPSTLTCLNLLPYLLDHCKR
jgi:hypothetical protein